MACEVATRSGPVSGVIAEIASPGARPRVSGQPTAALAGLLTNLPERYRCDGAPVHSNRTHARSDPCRQRRYGPAGERADGRSEAAAHQAEQQLIELERRAQLRMTALADPVGAADGVGLAINLALLILVGGPLAWAARQSAHPATTER